MEVFMKELDIENIDYEGLESEYKKKEDDLKSTMTGFIARHTEGIKANFIKQYGEGEYNPMEDKVFEDAIQTPDMGGLPGAAFELQNEVHNAWYGDGKNIETVKSKSAFNDYKKMVSKGYQVLEDYIDDNVTDDEMGRKVAKVTKVSSINTVKRAMKGYTPAYLATKTPLYVTVSSVTGASVDANFFTLKDKIKICGDEFPIFDATILSDDQLDTVIDYWEEKEKGTLTPEKTEIYRKNLYTQTLKLINYINKIDVVVNNPEKNQYYMNQQITSSNQPFHMSTIAARGLGSVKNNLMAYKIGLENGWDIDDIAVIAAFNNLVEQSEAHAQHSFVSKLENLNIYNQPRYSSREQEKYLEDMRQLYITISTTPIKSAEDRNKFLSEMNKMVKTGKEKEYFHEDMKHVAELFDDYYINAKRRSVKINKGKEPAVFNSGIREELTKENQLENILVRFNTKRTDLYIGSESDRHKLVRTTAESVQTCIQNKPGKNATAEEKATYYENYIARLEEMAFYAKKYAGKRNDAGTDAGKDRVRGANELEAFAKEEKMKALTELKAVGLEEYANGGMEAARLKISSKRKDKAENEIRGMENMPQNDAEKAAFENLVADIVADRLVNSNVEANKNLFNTMGANAFKDSIKASSEFKSMMKSIYRKRDITPAGTINELTTEKVVEKMTNVQKKFRKTNEEATREQAKKNAEKAARKVQM